MKGWWVIVAVLAAWPAAWAAETDPPEEPPKAAPQTPAAQTTDMAVIAKPEEFKAYLDAERQSIARERESLMALRVQVKKEIEELQSVQKQMDAKLAAADAQQDEKVKKLVKVYSAMRSDEIAPLLMRLDEDTALRILSQMKPKQQAEILARMGPDAAAGLSKKLLKKEF